MVKGCGDDMTKANFLRGSSSDSCLLGTRQSALIARLSGQRGCAHCAHLCARAAFRPDFDLFLLVLPVPLHEVLCLRRHDFAAWTVGVIGRSRVSGNVCGGPCGWRTSRRQSAGVWDPDSSSGGSPGLVDPPDFGAPSWQRCSLSLPRSTRRSGMPTRRDGTLRWRTGSGTARRRRPYPYNCAASRPQGRKARSLSMFQPATIPEPIMRSLSLARR
jgi:hypothetical protein